MVLLGRVGSGKTTQARKMLAGVPRWVVIDAKGDYPVSGDVPVVDHFKPSLPRQIIRPDDSAPQLATEDAMWGVLRRGDCVLYVDEATLSNPSRTVLTPAFGACIRTGRSLGVGTWTGTQRPKDVPNAVFTEMDHLVCFRLTYRPDRDKVVQFTSDDLQMPLATVRGHDHLYWCTGEEWGLYVRANRAA